MSCSLNSLKGVVQGSIYGSTIGIIKGDTRSLDYSSHAMKKKTRGYAKGAGVLVLISRFIMLLHLLVVGRESGKIILM